MSNLLSPNWRFVENELSTVYLKKIMYLIGVTGISSGTNKLQLQEKIWTKFGIFEQWRLKQFDNTTKNNFQIVSVDLGISNFSYSILRYNNNRDNNIDSRNSAKDIPELVEWAKYDLCSKYKDILVPKDIQNLTMAKEEGEEEEEEEKGKKGANSLTKRKLKNIIQFNPETVNNLADEIIKDILLLNRSSENSGELDVRLLLKQTAFLFEHQRTRTSSSSNVLESVYRNSVLEYVLFSKLQTMLSSSSPSNNQHNTLNNLSDAKKMCEYWIPRKIVSTLKKETTKTKPDSKKLRIKLVSKIFNDLGNEQLFSINDSFLTRAKVKENTNNKMITNFYNALQFTPTHNGVNKNDDLCDSLLHGLAWSQWFNTYKKLHNLLTTSSSTSLTVLKDQLESFIDAEMQMLNSKIQNLLKD